MLSDRATCALVDRSATIVWYCPERFDGDAIFARLLDERIGGFWSVEAAGKRFVSRKYRGNTSILETCFEVRGRPLVVTDWMGLGTARTGILRRFSRTPSAITNVLCVRPNYGRAKAEIEVIDATSVRFPKLGMRLSASHPIEREGDLLRCVIPQDCAGWAVFVEDDDAEIVDATVDASLAVSEASWNAVHSAVEYSGPYADEVHDSMRALQQMTCAASGGVVAAATTSLPEQIGAERNYDYRYVWTRDASLIMSALVLVEPTAVDAKRLLGFVARGFAEHESKRLSPYYAVNYDSGRAERTLPLQGFRNSTPVRIGNAATNQLQFDAHGHVLLAAKVLYQKLDAVIDWHLVEAVADYICRHWMHDDNGIWEENVRKPYTSSRVFGALGLEFMAAYCQDLERADRWRSNAAQIRAYVSERCRTKSGAFAVYAGSEEVDVTAALFPLWSYCEPDSPEMLATIREIETHWSRGGLYWRRLELFDSHREGAFLAASCWMASYYAVAGNVAKSRDILDHVLRFRNDLGFFAEEADVDTGDMLGNIPQTFVHSSFICAVNALKNALEGIDSRVR